MALRTFRYTSLRFLPWHRAQRSRKVGTGGAPLQRRPFPIMIRLQKCFHPHELDSDAEPVERRRWQRIARRKQRARSDRFDRDGVRIQYTVFRHFWKPVCAIPPRYLTNSILRGLESARSACRILFGSRRCCCCRGHNSTTITSERISYHFFERSATRATNF